MFTGIVSDLGEVIDVEEKAEGLRRVTVACGYDPESIDIGASIACSGICLTVVADRKPLQFCRRHRCRDPADDNGRELGARHSAQS
jgi:riboflavin synthase alpha subunit